MHKARHYGEKVEPEWVKVNGEEYRIVPVTGPEVVDYNRYFRLAGVASLLAFLASYSPGLLPRLLRERLEKGSPADTETNLDK